MNFRRLSATLGGGYTEKSPDENRLSHLLNSSFPSGTETCSVKPSVDIISFCASLDSRSAVCCVSVGESFAFAFLSLAGGCIFKLALSSWVLLPLCSLLIPVSFIDRLFWARGGVCARKTVFCGMIRRFNVPLRAFRIIKGSFGCSFRLNLKASEQNRSEAQI